MNRLNDHRSLSLSGGGGDPAYLQGCRNYKEEWVVDTIRKTEGTPHASRRSLKSRERCFDESVCNASRCDVNDPPPFDDEDSSHA